MAETSTTSNMNLILPTPGERLGPTWASDLNTALTTIDSHNHGPGQGAQIGVDGITIDGNLDFNKDPTAVFPAINMKYLSWVRQTAHPGVNNGLYSYGVSTGTDGDLWFRNNNGVILEDIDLVSGSFTDIEHKLGRKPRGYLVIRKSAAQTVYEDVGDYDNRKLFIKLRASGSVTVNLWVF